jgi:hypothetical protein
LNRPAGERTGQRHVGTRTAFPGIFSHEVIFQRFNITSCSYFEMAEESQADTSNERLQFSRT